jgi:hypothetical protein
MKLTELIAGIFRPAAELIDELHTSDEERLKARAHLLDVQAGAMDSVIEYETQRLEAQKSIIVAEAKSESWIARNWRPLTMLTFLSLVVTDSYGLLPNPLSEEAWLSIQIGLGGYVVGRSGEKIYKEYRK